MIYNDFRIQIERIDYGAYSANAILSPKEETATEIVSPDPLQIAALGSQLALQRFKSEPGGLQELGTLLFESLFTGDVLDLLRTAQTQLGSPKPGLCIWLERVPNELSTLPWELLYDPDTEEFWGISEHITIVRHANFYRLLTSRPPIAPPIRILALLSNPGSMPSPGAVARRYSTSEAFEPLISRGLAELISLEEPTVQEMVEALRERNVHILYYQGHIGFDPSTRTSYLLFKDSTKRASLLGMDALSDVLNQFSVDVRLAVINSCGMSSSILPNELVRRGMPAAVATQEPLEDKEMFAFLRGFSQALADRLPVDAAVSAGRRTMSKELGLQGRWNSPIFVAGTRAALFSREGQP